MIYQFKDNTEEFIVKDSFRYKNYFPLTNKWGSLLASISPNLAGDIKKDNDRFITPPATTLDLDHNLLCRREFFLKIFPLTKPSQKRKKVKIIHLSDPYPDKLQAGYFYHQLTKYTDLLNIEILNFIPHDLEAEVMQVTAINKSNKSLEISACSCIPLYGRSPATLRDHRHVSSLLNRIDLTKDGILLRPTLLFNEEGHSLNQTTYFCLGKSNRGQIKGQFPSLDYFCGEGNLGKPDAIYKNKRAAKEKTDQFDGKEVLGALQFKNQIIKPGEKVNYILALGCLSGPKEKCQKQAIKVFSQINTQKKVTEKLNQTKKYWRNFFSKVDFDFGDKNYNGWLRWVKAQPTLRKLFGCSFLPHFDYGKGGRGWRDLWQDALTLLYYEPKKARRLILASFKGVRIDGSNATIIKKDNTFVSDRNKISRVWSDHGVWPFITLKHYIDLTGDISILNQPLTYFQDHLFMRAKMVRANFNPGDFLLRTKKGEIYSGNVLEHLLIQHLTAFFNVGKNNIIRIENADWNDALDMAAELGETVTFSFIYASNLGSIAALLKELKKRQKKIAIFKKLTLLLDTLDNPVNYQSYKQKQKRLKQYLKETTQIQGQKTEIEIDHIIFDLEKKCQHLSSWLGKKEWLKEGFFNGYYDNQGNRVGGKHKKRVRMMLAPQVFAIMSGIATPEQIKQIWKSITKYLKSNSGGFRLNTDFSSLYQELGRAFGFQFGEKENGAFFNHMVVMLAYSLYKQGFPKKGALVLNSIYQLAISDSAGNYPQLPEYFNNQKRGLYLYLTGSASWYIHTLLNQVLGAKPKKNCLTVNPRLVAFRPAPKTVKLKLQIEKEVKGFSQN